MCPDEEPDAWLEQEYEDRVNGGYDDAEELDEDAYDADPGELEEEDFAEDDLPPGLDDGCDGFDFVD